MATAEQTFRLKESVYGFDSKPSYDIATHTLNDPKILGKISKNGFTFTPGFIEQCRVASQRAVANVDHSRDGSGRDMGSLFALVEQAYIDGKGELRAKTVKWNPEHKDAKNFEWALQNAPEKIGFSISADAKKMVDPSTNRFVVHELVSLDSYDIVYGPANTGNILEQEVKSMDLSTATVADLLAALSGKIMSDTSMDMGEKKKKMNGIMKMMDTEAETVSPEKKDGEYTEATALQEATKYTNSLVKALVGTVQTYQLKEQNHTRMAKATSKLQPDWITAGIKKAIETAKDDAEVEAIVADQVRLQESYKIKPPVPPVNPPRQGNPDPIVPVKFDKAAKAKEIFG